MACGSCGAAAARSLNETWIYEAPDGTRIEKKSKVEADILVTKNGGGTVRRK